MKPLYKHEQKQSSTVKHVPQEHVYLEKTIEKLCSGMEKNVRFSALELSNISYMTLYACSLTRIYIYIYIYGIYGS